MSCTLSFLRGGVTSSSQCIRNIHLPIESFVSRRPVASVFASSLLSEVMKRENITYNGLLAQASADQTRDTFANALNAGAEIATTRVPDF